MSRIVLRLSFAVLSSPPGGMIFTGVAGAVRLHRRRRPPTSSRTSCVVRDGSAHDPRHETRVDSRFRVWNFKQQQNFINNTYALQL